MKVIISKATIKGAIIGIIFFLGMMPLVFADVYINVMAVNGANEVKTTTVKQNLPGELIAQDILDTNGLQLDYNVNDANYYVHGPVVLQPKESKTFKITVRDVWKVTPEQVADIKSQVEEGYNRIGKSNDVQKADALKEKILSKLSYITDLQNSKSDSVERRIDSFRTYTKEMMRIKNDALSVEYWLSNPTETQQRKIIRMSFEVENPAANPKKLIKYKNYLPQEVRTEHVVESEGFEIRFDQKKQRSFLFKEEEFESGQKKKYTIGILDIWFILQKDIDYLRSRTINAVDFLKNSKYADSAKILAERIEYGIKGIETSQVQSLPIEEHISAFRANENSLNSVKHDLETLERLLAAYHETLEKTKVDNVLKKVKSLQSVSDISDSIFKKKFEADTAWKYIGIILLFAGFLTVVGFVVWSIRSKDKKIAEGPPAKAEGAKTEAKV